MEPGTNHCMEPGTNHCRGTWYQPLYVTMVSLQEVVVSPPCLVDPIDVITCRWKELFSNSAPKNNSAIKLASHIIKTSLKLSYNIVYRQIFEAQTFCRSTTVKNNF